MGWVACLVKGYPVAQGVAVHLVPMAAAVRGAGYGDRGLWPVIVFRRRVVHEFLEDVSRVVVSAVRVFFVAVG
ncbi:hypothetical protein HCJ93_27440 [Streptomyces sp. SBST2-5]|uniref:Secreted protein n=1 Tax=Streptomyces composti TaxID=2720025 RepID=A0ABX1AIT7_9ACTN|nr:hypothetical protein [Streptomyces composti]NJP53698.1 hypothetical protein [Streptomyces composti]